MKVRKKVDSTGQTPVVLFGSAYWKGLLDWLAGTVTDAGNISQLDPELVHVTDDEAEAVDFVLQNIER